MKKVMKKISIYFAVFMGVLMLSGVFAETVGLSDNVKDVVNNIVENQGMNKSDIQSVQEVSLDNLPSQIDVKNIDTTNLAIYEVNMTGTAKPFFVLTASDKNTQAATPAPSIYKMLLNFGLKGETNESTFLETANGVEGSTEKGYVMMRDGSITGLSTNLDVLSGKGDVQVIVYINGEPANFGNTLLGDSSGIKKDYDTQSLGVVKFEKGDVISIYVKTEGNIVIGDVINLVEISTE
jgi:hypothetical protein